MRDKPSETVELGRIREGAYASDPASNLGAFLVGKLHIIAGTGEGWEHVSVSREDRPPNWSELERVRKWFWREDETVMQLHVPSKEHVNVHDFCLHLWRPIEVEIPRPPAWMV